MMSATMTDEEIDSALCPPSADVVARLVAAHREFLAYLQPRVSSTAQAEEILQAAFVRTLERGGSIENEHSVVAWFYRVLDRALIDHYRRQASEQRALDAHATEPSVAFELEFRSQVCGCLNTLLPTLQPQYAEIVRRIDLQQEPLGEVAHALGISPNNAAVRLGRGRKALRAALQRSCGTCATHGCLDCTCGSVAGCH
jgi:RNA polymerase sigma-70 factor (ECF subfamily)